MMTRYRQQLRRREDLLVARNWTAVLGSQPYEVLPPKGPLKADRASIRSTATMTSRGSREKMRQGWKEKEG